MLPGEQASRQLDKSNDGTDDPADHPKQPDNTPL
jgi:hypothetical protein